MIDNTQFKNCSSVCAILVGFIFCCPEKYPVKTDDIDTNTIPGANTLITVAVSGTCKILHAIKSAPKNNPSEKTNPNTVKNAKAILKIRCAPALSPKANLSETSLEIALGIPVEDKVSSKEYI